MKQTRIVPLILAALVSAVGAYSVVKVAVSSGAQIPVSQWSMVLTLIAIAVVVVILAIPLIRYRRALVATASGKAGIQIKRVDPFYAYRLLLLAKATAVAGTLFLGWHFGVLLFQFASPVIAGSLLPRSISGCIASAALAVAGLIVERICKLPDSDPESSSTKPQNARPSGEGAAL